MSDDEQLVLPSLDFCVDDDPEILRAALDFIEACDASDSSEDADDVTTTPSASKPDDAVSAPTVPVAKPRAATRNRRKEEILELRKLVGELEKQVAGRKRKLHGPMPIENGVQKDHDVMMMDGKTMDTTLLWEQMSQRQQQQRRLAELENLKLRGMVLDQLKIARELTRAAKRRALLGERAESIPLPDEIFGSSSPPRHARADDESPLMVRIYPSRPSMPTRIGMAGLSESDASLELLGELDDAAMEGTPVYDAWKTSAVVQTSRVEGSCATRVAWQSMLRQFLARRRASVCHERLEEVIQSAISCTGTNTKDEADDAAGRLVYTKRYSEDSEGFSATWQPRAMWQSPSALLRSLFATDATTGTISLRLFRLSKVTQPAAFDGDDDASVAPTTRRSLVAFRGSCATRSMSQWQHSSLSASSCF